MKLDREEGAPSFNHADEYFSGKSDQAGRRGSFHPFSLCTARRGETVLKTTVEIVATSKRKIDIF